MNLFVRNVKNIHQRNWRHGVIRRLKAMLGNYCHGCQTAESNMTMSSERKDLHLVVPNRRAPIFERFGNNTVSIYCQILKGNLPLTSVTLLCDDCKFHFGKGVPDGLVEDDPGTKGRV